MFDLVINPEARACCDATQLKSTFYPLCKVTWLSLSNGVLKTNRGAPLAELVECRTRDCKVMGLILTRGAVMCS